LNHPDFFERIIILEDDLVRLEPLEEKHYPLLLPVAMEESLWKFTVAKINSDMAFRRYFDTALEEKKQRRSYPFAIFDKRKNEYAGSTRYGNIEFHHKKVEIGWTWITPSLQGTGFNKHCKFLLLSYGFDTLGLNRVELKTSSLNLRSQRAMEKIGAVREGVLRKNTINDDGTTRDTVYFSFLIDEWPAIKASLFSEFLPDNRP
jgi:N-acetyltransferase